ncbi:SusC/RagA family TonB-linked outer membrane protein [Flavitalea flava]
MTIQRLLAKVGSLALLCVLFTLSAFSQTKTITGKVSDDKGAPIQGATVSANGSKAGSSSGADGTFRIAVPQNAQTLIISSVGFNQQEISIGDQTSINVTLATATANLNEIVVIGYGTARKKDLTGSVGSVKAKDFNQGTIAAPDQLLQGKVAGLEITSNSGQPGAATTIKIRGNNSIRANNNPLYVVDGVPLDGRTARPTLDLGKNTLGFGPTPESNPLLYINPNDIAQMDVLKDASATAIYGSRGANGIIVITTKKSTSSGTKIEVGTNFGFAAGYMRKYKVLTASEFRSFSTKNNFKNDSGSTVDALKAITQSNLSQNYSLAFSGGNENGKFRASFYASKNNGFIKKTDLEKYLGNFSGSYKFLDKRLTLEFNLIAGHTKEDMGLISNTAGAGGNLMSWALNWNPTRSFRNSAGLYPTAKQSFSVPNPIAAIDAFNDVAKVNVFLGNISASFKITKDLEYKFLYAINQGTGTRNTNIDGWIDGIQGISGTGYAAISTGALTSQTFTHTLNYKTSLTEHLLFDAVAGYEYWKTDFSNTTAAAAQFNTNLNQTTRIPILYTSFFQNAKTFYPLTPTIDPTTEIQSYFGRVNFNLSDKYYLTATIRADGSNKFGSNNRYGYFPSVGARWVLSNEDFMKNSNLFSNLGLRASWGITGNQEFPSGASLEQFTSTAYNQIGQSNVANPDLKWEKTTSINIGLDYSLLKNRIYGSIDYYRKNTTDLLFQSTSIQPAPASIFFINLPAHLINTGVEFSIGANIVQQKSFSWDAGFNIAYNKNKLTEFNQAPIPTAAVSGQGVSGAFAQIITNNQPVNEYYLKKFKGYDQNGQNLIDDTASFAGDPNPHYLFGFNTTLTYKKLSLTLNASGASGYLIYNNTHNTITNISNISNGKNIDREGLNTKESLNNGVAASSRYLESGNFLKLRNLTFAYRFGDVGQYLKNVSAFVSGTNLLAITKFSGFDPEVNVDKNNNNYPSRNMEYIPYPTPRIISFGVNFGL